MANLISPNVSVSIIDESFYVAGRQSTLPLIFIATEDEKVQVDGVTPALGTYESGVLRVVTSIKQALELYGVPKYHYSVDGTPHHGDVRNEYGLDALLKFLEVGNRAYVVRANVNLNDDYADIKAMWTRKVADAAELLNEMVEDYIVSYNEANGLIPADSGYKETVTKEELKQLIDEAMADVYAKYSFSTDLFEIYFTTDHTVDQPAHQDVLFETSGGFLQLSDVTGYEEDTDYTAEVRIVDGTGTHIFDITVNGTDVVTFGDLIDALNDEFGVSGTAELISGRIRITSSLDGVTSDVEIVTDGISGTNPLFASLNLFKSIADTVPGTGATPLVVYNDTYETIVGGYDGLDAIVDAWAAGLVVVDEFTGDEAEALLIAAAADFDNTKEFKEETALGANDSLRRAEIAARLAAEVNSATNGVRGENLEYNLLLAPGFPELADEMLRLSTDMLGEVFVIGETPFDKPPAGPNGINNWARTPARATSDAIAYAYPHGLSSNIDGLTILTTASATMLRTFAFNDAEAELWWAPAGTRRGRCEHLSTIGYVSGALGGPTTFVEDFIDLGTRDELYEFPKNINPISYIPGRGILVMGQKTAAATTSALDRINVSRMVKFIKRELRKAVFAFLFEPNDDITRAQAKFTVDNFLATLMDRRGLYDFATLCNKTNNTPDRIDRNELWIDVAIKPVKAVEYIYIPIRIVNTGADIGTGRQ